MRSILIAAVLVAAAGSALADYIAHQGDDSVRLTMSACTDPEVAQVIQGVGHRTEDFRQAQVHLDGKDWPACWQAVELPEGGTAAFIVYPDGSGGLIPRELFKLAPEA
jgi:hypothetical protein